MAVNTPFEQLLMIGRLLVLIVVFLFASQVIRVLRRGLPHPTEGPIGRGTLEVVRGDGRLRAGERMALGSVTTFGRAPDNTVVLADRLASRHHARLNWQAGECLVTDLGSKAGTLVNDVPAGPEATALLVGGAIRMSQVELRRIQ